MSRVERYSSWQVALAVGGFGTFVILLWFWPTVMSIEAIWRRSGNFTHGYAIVPIVGYMLWTLKDDIVKFQPSPGWSGLVITLFAAVLWSIAKLVDVLVVEQLALVLMIQALWLAVLGWRLTVFILVPLLYLFFAVPFGQGLEPYLQDYTAWFSVQALKLSGIPVLWEGLFITIPTGAFEVAEACSGMRYLVASLALGVLYAFLNFYSWRYRLSFIALSIIVPIVANGVRAYLIIILAHLSNNRLAVGVDHLIYGWLFFGLVMYLLFLFGNKLRRREGSVPEVRSIVPLNRAAGVTGIVGCGVLAVAFSLSVKPLYASVFSTKFTVAASGLELPQSIGRWQRLSTPARDWNPKYVGADALEQGSYQRAGGSVDYAVYFYANQQQGAELGSTTNYSYDPNRWRVRSTYTQFDIASSMVFVEQRLHSQSGAERLVWRVYWVSGKYSNQIVFVKLREAWMQLTGGYQGSAVLLISALVTDGSVDNAREVLRDFSYQASPRLSSALSRLISQ